MARDAAQADFEMLEYVRRFGVREHPALEAIREHTLRHPCAKMMITPEEGALLAFLVKACHVRTILEVGVFTGYSSTAMALALPEDGLLTAIDRNKDWISRAERFWKKAEVNDKIKLMQGDALEIIGQLSTNQYDMIFIDADKKSYKQYHDQVYPLLKKGGILIYDNTYVRYSSVSIYSAEAASVMDEFNQYISNDERYNISMLPFADGITLLYKI